MVQLHRRIDDIHAEGGELYVIGNGSPSFIAGFRETTGFTGTVLTDPSLEVFRAAELKRGLRTFVSLGAAARTVGAFARGYRQGRTQGDNTQQGGVLVIARDGRVLWQHVSASPGDNADPGEIVRALRASQAERRA
ncbi:MAG TPA: peroxiredoxin-like family protein [Kofleriaceae bacterium]